MKDEEAVAILICGDPKPEYPDGWETKDETCADCGKHVVRRPDPEVPENAVKLCWDCAETRIKGEEAKGEVIQFNITKQNKTLLERLGYSLKEGGRAN